MMCKVLIVDDDADTLALLKLRLEREGFEVVTSEKVTDIQKLAIETQPNSILLDVNLKGADGRKVCETLNHTSGTEQIPVILYSGNQEKLEHPGGCDAEESMSKPLDMKLLVETLRSNCQ